MTRLATGARRRLAAVAGRLYLSDNKSVSAGSLAVAEVNSYKVELFRAEKAIIERLGNWLSGKKMLDIGVGAGRTTASFAPLVASYVGVDYSPPMIAACESRLGHQFSNVSLLVGDARDLSAFDTASFDFVFFSFNGLDCVDHADRFKVLSEMRRVCRPDGRICFSAHNIYAAAQLFHLRPHDRSSSLALIRGVIWQFLLRVLNDSPAALAQRPYAIVRDGALKFRVTLYYIRPSVQLAQLAEAGFSDVEIFGHDGQRISPDDVDDSRDLSLHYLASPAGGGHEVSASDAASEAASGASDARRSVGARP